MKAKAAVLYEYNTPQVVEEIEVDSPQQGEVMIKVAAAGVCYTHYHVIKGSWAHTKCPVVMGDEGSGIIAEVGPGVTSVKPGDHVVLSYSPTCRNCFYCDRGIYRLCENPHCVSRFRKGDMPINSMGVISTFAEYTVMADSAVVPIRNDVPLEKVALLGCAVPTGWGAVVKTAKVEPGSSVAIIGLGGIGLSAVMGAVTVHAGKIIGVDIKESKLEMARGFGVTHTINSAEEDVVSRVRELTDGRGADYTFDTIGRPEVTRAAFTAVRPGGTAVTVGMFADTEEITLPAPLLATERNLLGCSGGSVQPPVDIPILLDLYMAGKLDLDRLVTKSFPIEQINEAFDAMLAGEVARGIVVF